MQGETINYEGDFMKKVVLVALNSSFSHTNLALRYIRNKLLIYKQIEVVFIEKTINDTWLNLFEELISHRADVYAFSCYIWNRELIEQLSLNLKRILSDAAIIWGGPDASSQSAELLQRNPYLDAIISSEGDSVTAEWIVNYLFSKNNYDVNRKIISESEELHWTFPYSDEELVNLNDRILYYEGSRGCAYRCSYCLSANTFRTRFKPLEEVFEELEHILHYNPRQLKFIDRTFNSDAGRAKKIWQFLIGKSTEMKTRTNFHFEIAAELITQEQIEVLKSSPQGLFQFEIGAQTTNPEVLKLIHRPYHPEQFKEKVVAIKNLGNIHVHLDLIAGLPSETLASQIQSANELLLLDPEMLQMGFLKVLPNVPIRLECDKRGMIYQNFPPYEILQSDAMSADDLMLWREVEAIVDDYYNSGLYYYFIQFLIAQVKRPIRIFMDLYHFISQKYSKQKISQKDRFHVLAMFLDEFIESLLSNKNENEYELNELGNKNLQNVDAFRKIAIDLLKVDYLNQGLKAFPDWFVSLQNKRDKQSQEMIKKMNFTLIELGNQKRVRFEKFGFSLSALPGFQHKKTIHYQGAGKVMPSRQQLMQYLSAIDKESEYYCGLHIGHGETELLIEQRQDCICDSVTTVL